MGVRVGEWIGRAVAFSPAGGGHGTAQHSAKKRHVHLFPMHMAHVHGHV